MTPAVGDRWRLHGRTGTVTAVDVGRWAVYVAVRWQPATAATWHVHRRHPAQLALDLEEAS